MDNILERIADLEKQIRICTSQLKPQFLIEDDCEYQEQLELRWYISDLQGELDKLKEENAAEEWIEGWG